MESELHKEATTTEGTTDREGPLGLDFVEVMRSRRSMKAVVAPGPTQQQIDTALSAAACAPDHAALRVWRFTTISQPDIVELGERAFKAMESDGKPMTPEKKAKTREWLKGVPLLVAMAYQIHHDNPKVPELEQTLSMGAAVMNFQNAMHAMGFSTFWSSGLGTFTEEIPTMLGFDPLDYQFVGFLAVGTQSFTPPPINRVKPESISSRWVASKS